MNTNSRPPQTIEVKKWHRRSWPRRTGFTAFALKAFGVSSAPRSWIPNPCCLSFPRVDDRKFSHQSIEAKHQLKLRGRAEGKQKAVCFLADTVTSTLHNWLMCLPCSQYMYLEGILAGPKQKSPSPATIHRLFEFHHLYTSLLQGFQEKTVLCSTC